MNGQDPFHRIAVIAVVAASLFIGCASYQDSYLVHHIQKAEIDLLDPPSTVAVPPDIDGIGQFIGLRARYAEAPTGYFTTPTDTPYHQDGVVGYPGNYRVGKSPAAFGLDYRIAAETPEYFLFDGFASFDAEPPRGTGGGWKTAETFGFGVAVRTPWVAARLSPAFGFTRSKLRVRDSVAVYSLSDSLRNSWIDGSPTRAGGVFGTLGWTFWLGPDLLQGLPRGLVPYAGAERTAFVLNGLAGPFYYDLKKTEWTAGLHYDSPHGIYTDVSGSWTRLEYRGTDGPGYYRAEVRVGSNLAPLIRTLTPD